MKIKNMRNLLLTFTACGDFICLSYLLNKEVSNSIVPPAVFTDNSKQVVHPCFVNTNEYIDNNTIKTLKDVIFEDLLPVKTNIKNTRQTNVAESILSPMTSAVINSRTKDVTLNKEIKDTYYNPATTIVTVRPDGYIEVITQPNTVTCLAEDTNTIDAFNITTNIQDKVKINELGNINWFYRPYYNPKLKHQKQKDFVKDNTLKKKANYYTKCSYDLNTLESLNKELSSLRDSSVALYSTKFSSVEAIGKLSANSNYSYENEVYLHYLEDMYNIKIYNMVLTLGVTPMGKSLYTNIYKHNLMPKKIYVFYNSNPNTTNTPMSLEQNIAHHFSVDVRTINTILV